MKFLKSILPLIVVLALSYLIIKPLLIPGFFPIHDDTQVARVYEMTKSLRDGMFPVRWVSDLGYGYGYPIFNFYAPLAYYVGALLQFLNFDALVATKLMMIIGMTLSGIFMYLLGKEFWGKLGGIVSAAFYLYAPYHAVDLFIRGDVAEFWAYAFIPLTFLGLYKVFKSKGSLKWVTIGSFSYAFLILSHNLTAMMVTPFLLAFFIVLSYISYRQKNLPAIYYLLSTLFLGLFLSAFYFIPALLEQRYTNVISQIGGGADYKDHFVCAAQLWQSQWGFGGSSPGCVDGVSFMIGKVHILASLLAVAFASFLFFKKKRGTQIKAVALCILGLAASIALMLFISKPLWDRIPLMAFFQYPWRFLLLASFFSSMLAGSVIWFFRKIFINKWVEYTVFVVLTTAVVILNIKFFTPQTIFNKTASDYTNEATLKWTTSKISDEYMPRDFPKPTNEKDVVGNTVSFDSADIKIASRQENAKKITLNLEALKPTKLHFNIAYFPSWKLTVDGNSQGSIVSRGYDVSLTTGAHIVEMRFVQSPIEIFSNLLSILGLLALIFAIIRNRKKISYE